MPQHFESLDFLRDKHFRMKLILGIPNFQPFRCLASAKELFHLPGEATAK